MHPILFLFCLIISTTAFAQDACFHIKNSGLRSYCLANSQKDPVFCYGIKNKDSRNLCLARFSSPTNCLSIENNDIRHLCLGYYISPTNCFSIKNNDLKNYCIGAFNKEIHYCEKIEKPELQVKCVQEALK